MYAKSDTNSQKRLFNWHRRPVELWTLYHSPWAFWVVKAGVAYSTKGGRACDVRHKKKAFIHSKAKHNMFSMYAGPEDTNIRPQLNEGDAFWRQLYNASRIHRRRWGDGDLRWAWMPVIKMMVPTLGSRAWVMTRTMRGVRQDVGDLLIPKFTATKRDDGL